MLKRTAIHPNLRIIAWVMLVSASCADWIAPVHLGAATCESHDDCDDRVRCYRGVCLAQPDTCLVDGLLSLGEDCDDGNSSNEDGCTNDCFEALCGDGWVRRDVEPGEPGYEMCDPEAANGNRFCRFDCRWAPRPEKVAVGRRYTLVLRTGRSFVVGVTNTGNHWAEIRPPFPAMSALPSISNEVILIDDSGSYFSGNLPWRDAMQLPEPYQYWVPKDVIVPPGTLVYRHSWTGWARPKTTCYLDNLGYAFCSGSNRCGQAHPSAEDEHFDQAQALELGQFVDLVRSRWSTCALDLNGAVSCWGDLLPPAEDGDCQPTGLKRIAIPTAVDAVSGGWTSYAAVTTTGEVWQWGTLLNAAATSVPESGPAQAQRVDLPEAAFEVASGEQTHCALLVSGRVACWGRYNGAELSDQVSIMANLTDVRGLIPGQPDAGHQCAEREDGKIFCWGGNGNGRLGNGTTDTQEDPVELSVLP